MLRAFILGKDRRWKKKNIYGTKEIFKKGIYEYEIHPDAVYWYSILGLKVVRRIDFIEGIRLPLVYDNLGNAGYTTSMFTLDDASYIISKSMKSIYILITMLLSAGCLMLLIIVLLKLFGMLENGGN
jgi:hypothetical protein